MAETRKNVPPQTDTEWTIHALNIQGTFFERRCQDVVRNATGWKIQDSNYPVEFRGKASNLDIWAERDLKDLGRLVLPIECKKNNPDFIDWIFFPHPAHRSPYSLVQMLQVKNNFAGNSWTTHREFRQLDHGLTIADEARETKGRYQNKDGPEKKDQTRTSTTAITDAASQIALATQALIVQEYRVLEERKQINQKQNTSALAPYNQLFFFPTIVTTANIFTCQFKDGDVDLMRGEIPFSKGMLTQWPYLMFDYSIPSALQSSPEDMGLDYTREVLERQARMSIFIVQSAFFPSFLECLATSFVSVSGGWLEVRLDLEYIEALQKNN